MADPQQASTLRDPGCSASSPEHLTQHRAVSPRTIAAYRDTFRLLLLFIERRHRQGAGCRCPWPISTRHSILSLPGPSRDGAPQRRTDPQRPPHCASVRSSKLRCSP